VWGSIGAEDIVHDVCFLIDAKREQLILTGIPVSYIEAVPKLQELPIDTEALPLLLEHFELCNKPSNLYEFSFDVQESRVEALWRTMILNYAKNSTSNPPGEEWKSAFSALVACTFGQRLHESETKPAKDKALEALDEIYSNFGEELIAGELPSLEEIKDIEAMMNSSTKTSETLERRSGIVERAAQFITAWTWQGAPRQFFRAENGMLGSGMQLARPGDHIWFLQRMNTPVLLRPTETPDQFKIVGECYLHGCMNGELFSHRYLNKNSAKPIVIV
jgi:hypothetical protein